MPIAMLTLGMSPEVTLDICVNLLDPVVQRLNNSIIQNGKAPSVDAIIKEVYANDPVTMNSLLKVYSFAQELRILTSFFKINQGVTAQYVELLSFYNSLSQSLPRLAKLQGNSKESPIELNQIFALDSNNPEVVNNTLQKFEQYKVGINAMDVIMKNENFFQCYNHYNLNLICFKIFLEPLRLCKVDIIKLYKIYVMIRIHTVNQ